MKKHTQIIVGLIVGIACAFGAIALTGCGSTPTATATHIVGTQIDVVDTAMHAWADWVKAGKATQQQKDAVKAMYAKYFVAAEAEGDALTAWVNTKAGADPAVASTAEFNYRTALAIASSLQADLVELIGAFTGKK